MGARVRRFAVHRLVTFARRRATAPTKNGRFTGERGAPRQEAVVAVGTFARSAMTCSKTLTMVGSNCVPAHRRSSASASWIAFGGA